MNSKILTVENGLLLYAFAVNTFNGWEMVNDAFMLGLSLFRFTSQARKRYFNFSSLSCTIPVGLYLSLHASNKLKSSCYIPLHFYFIGS